MLGDGSPLYRKWHNTTDWLNFGPSRETNEEDVWMLILKQLWSSDRYERKYFHAKGASKHSNTLLLFLKKTMFFHGQIEKFQATFIALANMSIS